MAARIAITAMTTRSSMSVKPAPTLREREEGEGVKAGGDSHWAWRDIRVPFCLSRAGNRRRAARTALGRRPAFWLGGDPRKEIYARYSCGTAPDWFSPRRTHRT